MTTPAIPPSKQGAEDSGRYFRYMAEFVGFTDVDATAIARTKPHIEARLPDIVAEFYDHLLRYPPTRQLFLKKDGSVAVPYNVRVTQSLLDIFGEKVAWLSKQTEAYNTSVSYGARNPSAIVVPRFMCVKDLEISHSNTSY